MSGDDYEINYLDKNMSCVLYLQFKESDHVLVLSPAIFRVIPRYMESIP